MSDCCCDVCHIAGTDKCPLERVLKEIIIAEKEIKRLAMNKEGEKDE